MTFAVPVVRVDKIEDHPEAAHLSVVQLAGNQVVTMKDENGNFRFEEGQPVVYVPENSIVPDTYLKQYGFWNDEKNEGMLAGKKGNRVKASNFRGVRSTGLIWDAVQEVEGYPEGAFGLRGFNEVAILGDDVSAIFNITEYVPQ